MLARKVCDGGSQQVSMETGVGTVSALWSWVHHLGEVLIASVSLCV